MDTLHFAQQSPFMKEAIEWSQTVILHNTEHMKIFK